MEKKEIVTREMTAAELREYELFLAARAKREAAAKRKADRAAYAQLVDESVKAAMPGLERLSAEIGLRKREVMESFRSALALKAELFGTPQDQRTHTFTTSDGKMRITLGRYSKDDYRDTVEEGIGMVKGAIEGLAKDEESRALVKAVLRLLSRDQKGTLKASRVLQLRKLASESGNEVFQEGVRIIEESYQPTSSKEFVRAEVRDAHGGWRSVPLGMTEACG